MIPRRWRTGFTLIEVLIIVVILAVLAATIIPQFWNSDGDAKEGTLKFNLHTLRNQIQLYRAQHEGACPEIADGALPQLISPTDAAGRIGAGDAYPIPPCLTGGLPLNPLNNSAVVIQATAVPPTGELGNAGWIYDAATGQIWANNKDFLDF